MKEPRIQYALTEDGVHIAYWKAGSGPPLVIDVGQFSHVQKEWQIPERRAWLELTAEHFTVVRFDHRGCGLSDRKVDDLSLDAWVRDTSAVIDAIGAERAALFAAGAGQAAGIKYAAEHPETIGHLVLWQVIDIRDRTLEALRTLTEIDWEFYTDALVLFVQGWSAGDASARIGEYIRATTTADVARKVSEEQRKTDLTALLAQIQMPTLLLYRPSARSFSEELPRSTAALVPHARIAFLEGTTHAWYVPDSEQLVETMASFVEEHTIDTEEPSKQPSTVQELVQDVHVVLFTDIESSSQLAHRHGDAAAHGVRRAHDTIVRGALAEHRGAEVKHTGDGIMAAFAMASQALQCAIAIQRGVATHVDEHPDSKLAVYIGLNAGEPIAEDADLFGTSVDLAARICSHAQPGQILASDVVRQLAAGKGFLFADIGAVEPKGFEEPVRLYEVRWRDDG